MPKGELTVTINVAGVEPFKTFLDDVESIYDDARVLWPLTGLHERLDAALKRFRTDTSVDDQGPGT